VGGEAGEVVFAGRGTKAVLDFSAISYQLSAISYQLSAISYQLSAIGCEL
jgi:hypothetical protein